MSSLLPFIVSERARVTERPSSGLQAKVTILHCINYAIQEAASVLVSAEISEQVSSSLRVISRRAAFINFVFPSRSKEKFWERTDECRAFARLSIRLGKSSRMRTAFARGLVFVWNLRVTKLRISCSTRGDVCNSRMEIYFEVILFSRLLANTRAKITSY